MSALTEQQIQIIKASIPVLESSGVDLTFGMYDHMFHTHPEVLPYFNRSHHLSRRQPKILAYSLLLYAKNIEDLTPLTEFVNHVVSKHVGLQVKAEHYPVVGECILYQLHKMLGDEIATPEFLKAWEVAYTQLATILIDAELASYKENLQLENGWSDFKPFKVSKVEQESSDIRSIWFKPVDGKLVTPKPGQYICIRLTPHQNNIITQREYTLSEFFNGESYKISVRLDAKGVASSYIHNDLQLGDEVHLAQPNGELSYQVDDEISKLVLIAGGIGITPMIPILEFGLRQGKKVELYWSNKTVKSLPFMKYFKLLQEQYGQNLKLSIFITEDEDTSDDKIFRRIAAKDLATVDKKDSIYLVGPHNFTTFIFECLGAKGIESSQIHTEEYGPITV